MLCDLDELQDRAQKAERGQREFSAEVEKLRAEVERLLALNEERRQAYMGDANARLKLVAERQREACVAAIWAKSQCCTASELGEIASHVRATPLVTEEP